MFIINQVAPVGI